VKRPERPTARPAPSTTGRSTVATPPRQPPAPPRSDPKPRTTEPRPPRETPRRVPRPAAERSPRAEVRTAVRNRQREERREVKRFTRRARRRRAGWFAGIGVVLVLALLVVAAVYSPLLALRTITVDGTNRVSASAVEKALAPDLGTPLALLDDATITRQLGSFRLIRSYTTELQPPSTLIVHVTERTPVGVIQGADDFQLVDPAGVVVDRSAKRPDGVPLIQLGDAPLSGPGFASMSEVLLALPDALRAQVDTVAALTHDDVTLTLRGSGQHVIWGSADQSALKAQVLSRLIALHGQSGSGTYTVSAPQFAVFNPGDVTSVGGASAPSTPIASPGSTTAPTPAPTGGADQGGIQR
jgi:cell division protein FtsQ